ncbi:hypothetical protein ABVV53_01570 [Novosphingobium sp. RD2P27]|uniref:Uncharacterized protein n=1 Tax=Novosphingobium kalidii TaxID=3230299 RepID=A0ABV2CX25_9SPHN
MRSLYCFTSLAALVALAACRAPANDSEAPAPETAQTAADKKSGAAILSEREVPGFDIEVPQVSDINAAAAERINATLSSEDNGKWIEPLKTIAGKAN